MQHSRAVWTAVGIRIVSSGRRENEGHERLALKRHLMVNMTNLRAKAKPVEREMSYILYGGAAYIMLVRPKLEYASPTWMPYKLSNNSPRKNSALCCQICSKRSWKNNQPNYPIVLTLNWQTLERRRIIKQAMTFYKIINNIIKISPPTALLTRSHNWHHSMVTSVALLQAQ